MNGIVSYGFLNLLGLIVALWVGGGGSGFH